MRPLLRMRDAAFEASGLRVGPITLDVGPGERVARACGSGTAAAVVAMLAAAIVKPTSGSVLLDDYDPRVQPAHCKRVVGFVPHDPLGAGATNLEAYAAYRAALWGIDAMRAVAHAKVLLERLDGMHEAFAYPLIGALLAEPKLLVLDRPQPAYAQAIVGVAGSLAIFSTHAGESEARAFAPPPELAFA